MPVVTSSDVASAFANSNMLNTVGGAESLTSFTRKYSNQIAPKTVGELLAWADYLWNHHGLYAESIKKAVRYFMTEVELYGGDEVSMTDRRRYADVLDENFDVMCEAGSVGEDVIALGNSFTSMYRPFDRLLVCPKCGSSRKLEYVYPGSVKWTNYQFQGKCFATAKSHRPCSWSGTFEIEDVLRKTTGDKPVIIRWPPQYMHMTYHPLSRAKSYLLDIQKWGSFCQKLEKGDPLFLRDTPLEVIKAAQAKKKLALKEEEVYHMSGAPLSTSIPSFAGWGVPRFMSEFDTVVMIFMLDRYNEMLIKEYLVPFRAFSPPAQVPGTQHNSMDVYNNINLGSFKQHMLSMIKNHSANPTDWNVLPIPVQYQVFGGEAANLIPVEIMQHMELRLITGIGIPQDLALSSPGEMNQMVRFELFERSWSPFVSAMNGWMTWLTMKQAEFEKDWPNLRAKFIPVSVQTDEMSKQRMLDLASAQQVSWTTALRSIGVNRRREQEMIIDEQAEDQRKQSEAMQDMEKQDITQQAMRTPAPGEEQLIAEQQAAEGGAPGGAPPAAGPGGPAGIGPAGAMPPDLPPNASMQQLDVAAEQWANMLHGMESSQRKSQLLNLNENNPSMHALVVQKLSDLDTQAEQQGRIMSRQGQI